MRVLVTGATGQVGSAIGSHLAGRHSVIGLSRKSPPVGSIYEQVEAALGAEGAVRRVEQCVRPCDAIVHAAAAISGDPRDSAISLTNCLGTQQVVELALDWGNVPVIFLSSVPVIGRPGRLPITEDHPVAPPSIYHASKIYGEHLMAIAARNGCRTVSLRLTSPAGPGTPDSRILGRFVRQSLAGEALRLAGRGTRSQNYVDVRDIAAAVEGCLATGVTGVFNVAAQTVIANIDLAAACVRLLKSGSVVEFTGMADPEDDISWDVDISKARREFGYQPRFGIEDSIRALAHEYGYPQ